MLHNKKKGYLSQFETETMKTWEANSSTGNTPMAIKKLVPMATHSFPVPSNLISILFGDLKLKKHLTR